MEAGPSVAETQDGYQEGDIMVKLATTLCLAVVINIKEHSPCLQIWYKVGGGALRSVPTL